MFALEAFKKKYASQMGLIYALISNVLIVIGHFFVQRAAKHMTSVQVLYLTGIQLSFYNYLALSYKKMTPYSKKASTNRMLFLRGAAGFCGACTTLSGLALIPLSESIIIQMLSPVLTSLLAVCLLNEKYDVTLFFVTIFSFFGVVLVSKPEFVFGERETDMEYPFRALGVILTLAASGIGAIVAILIRKLGSISDPNSTAFYFGASLSICGPIVQLFQGIRLISIEGILWIIILGMLRYLSHITINMAFALEQANKVSLMQYAMVPVAYVIDVFIVGIEVDMYSVIGSASVFSCLFILLYKNYKNSKQPVKSLATPAK